MSVVVRRVGPEAAADVLAVVQEAFGARPALDPPADALGEDLRGRLGTDPAYDDAHRSAWPWAREIRSSSSAVTCLWRSSSTM